MSLSKTEKCQVFSCVCQDTNKNGRASSESSEDGAGSSASTSRGAGSGFGLAGGCTGGWRSVFGAVSGRELRLYECAPWSPEAWASPSITCPLIATRKDDPGIFYTISKTSGKNKSRLGLAESAFPRYSYPDCSYWKKCVKPVLVQCKRNFIVPVSREPFLFGPALISSRRSSTLIRQIRKASRNKCLQERRPIHVVLVRKHPDWSFQYSPSRLGAHIVSTRDAQCSGEPLQHKFLGKISYRMVYNTYKIILLYKILYLAILTILIILNNFGDPNNPSDLNNPNDHNNLNDPNSFHDSNSPNCSAN
ncbi:Beta-2-syntrophin [Camponotus floridanus]|uniref:Beta-2-syntrophin n=1 Tax=Camponotus floridanus TaxID=104421 RepID=E2ANT0_CAMFO|nr:Beta-2-syntrophin [Camponotus floridanus]